MRCTKCDWQVETDWPSGCWICVPVSGSFSRMEGSYGTIEISFLLSSSFLFFFFLAKWLRLNLCELNVDIVQPLYSALLVSTGTAPVPRQALILPRLSHFRRSLWEAVLKPGHPPSVPHICCRAILLKNSRFKHCSTRTRGSPPQRSPPIFCCGRGSVT